MICVINDCSNKSISKGLCDKHRTRLKRHGNPLVQTRFFHKTPEEAFNSIMGVIDNTNKCILWKGKFDAKGYGIISANYEHAKAHRVSYEINKGKINKNMCICHKCDNKSCVNPKHLWSGTHKENMQDALSKGRIPNPPKMMGESNYNSKFTTQDILKIREKYKKIKNIAAIAREYSVTPRSISLIVKRISWPHVK